MHREVMPGTGPACTVLLSTVLLDTRATKSFETILLSATVSLLLAKYGFDSKPVSRVPSRATVAYPEKTHSHSQNVQICGAMAAANTALQFPKYQSRYPKPAKL